MTDGPPAYRSIGGRITHKTIDHEIEYVRRDADIDVLVHTQNIENYWSIFKRGLIGTFHHVSRCYLDMYLHEFDYRAGSRKATDGARFASLLGQARGKRLTWFCRTPQPSNPFA